MERINGPRTVGSIVTGTLATVVLESAIQESRCPRWKLRSEKRSKEIGETKLCVRVRKGNRSNLSF